MEQGLIKYLPVFVSTNAIFFFISVAFIWLYSFKRQQDLSKNYIKKANYFVFIISPEAQPHIL